MSLNGWRTVARFTAGLWSLEGCEYAVLPLVGSWRMGQYSKRNIRRSRHGMADDWCFSYQSSPARRRRKRGNQAMAKTKGWLNTKIHLAVDAHGLPIRIKVTHGTAADCSQALDLVQGLNAEALMADRAYDTNDILDWLKKHSIENVIPPKKDRTEQRSYDKYLYRLRHIVENTFLHFKQWRGIAIRYAKNTASQFRAIIMWLK